VNRFKIHFALAALALLFVASSIGTTLAVTKYIGESVHIINTAGVKGQIIEQYDGSSSLYPGATVDKVVNVKNTGESDIVVRVKVEKRWDNPNFPVDNISIVYDNTVWLYDEQSGYYYYKGVLAPGEMTSKPLFKDFSVSGDLGNEYQGQSASITVKMECVQAGGNGISLWNKNLAYIGESGYVGGVYDPVVTSSTFVGIAGGSDFTFSPDNTDLFLNYKDLLPGETRSQTIEVLNSFGQSAEIFLRAEDLTQTNERSQGFSGLAADPVTLALIDDLLKKYVSIVVTDDTGRVIYSGPIWGRPDSDDAYPAAMKNDISLGVFAVGEKKTLTVQMQVDPNLGNEYQNLLGLIKWIWTAEVPDPPVPPVTPPPPPDPVDPPVDPPPPPKPPKPDVPKTGDTTNIWLWAALMTASGLMLGLGLRYRRSLIKRADEAKGAKGAHG
jgi:hypothetical protein